MIAQIKARARKLVGERFRLWVSPVVIYVLVCGPEVFAIVPCPEYLRARTGRTGSGRHPARP